MSKIAFLLLTVLVMGAMADQCFDDCVADCKAQGMTNEAVIYHICKFKCEEGHQIQIPKITNKKSTSLGKFSIKGAFQKATPSIKRVVLGSKFTDFFKKALDKVETLVNKYGPKAEKLIEKHGPKAIEMLEKYGPKAIEMLEKLGKSQDLGLSREALAFIANVFDFRRQMPQPETDGSSN